MGRAELNATQHEQKHWLSLQCGCLENKAASKAEVFHPQLLYLQYLGNGDLPRTH